MPDANVQRCKLFRIYGKKSLIDIGKNVNKAQSFLAAFWHPHCSIIGVEAVPGWYQTFIDRRNIR